MTHPAVIAAPESDVRGCPAELACIMSPAQGRALEDLRLADAELTFTPIYVHGISGMLEVQVCRGMRELRTIGLTGSGGQVTYAIIGGYRKVT